MKIEIAINNDTTENLERERVYAEGQYEAILKEKASKQFNLVDNEAQADEALNFYRGMINSIEREELRC